MLKLKKIYKSYIVDDVANDVLSNIDVSFKENTINTIYGNSGIGKTTLLNIIGLISKPDSGDIIINNKSVNLNIDLSKYRSKFFGYIFQDHYLMPEFTIYENMQLPRLISNRCKDDLNDKIFSLLKLFNLKHIAYKYPINVSVGEAQRIAILRSIINHPKVVIADEPTSNLDDSNAMNVLELFKALKDKYNYTIIIATHDKRFLDISNNSYKLSNKKLVEL